MSLGLCQIDASVCSAKVRMGHARKGRAWHVHHPNLRAGDGRQPGCVRRDHGQVVPILIVQGVAEIRCRVILEYSDDARPAQ